MFDGWKTLNRAIPPEVSSPISTEQIEDFISRLDDSVRSRVASIPSNSVDLLQSEIPVARLGVLFSGGIDSSVVAYLADRMNLSTFSTWVSKIRGLWASRKTKPFRQPKFKRSSTKKNERKGCMLQKHLRHHYLES
ncbi:hypothetical protein RSAG8_01599, partial [Rhizoctonia solani AG-8 WAC10335]